ncbi:hypothetical protein CIPAW_15G108200 [Carya illinoinensis]|uniref:Uncharacterized protein n=1 Tax=Carya illinoinensis TaxID=32201 RepID=A0A8T1NDM3_CARIL|nr:hypothetical protein CIPAW_15G108200 [Carya illinoinensis]
MEDANHLLSHRKGGHHPPPLKKGDTCLQRMAMTTNLTLKIAISPLLVNLTMSILLINLKELTIHCTNSFTDINVNKKQRILTSVNDIWHLLNDELIEMPIICYIP